MQNQWKRISEIFRPYWRQEVFMLLCMAAVSCLGLIPATLTANIIDTAVPRRDEHLLGADVLLIVASAVAASLISVLQGYWSSLVGESIMRDLRLSLVGRLRKAALSFFVDTKNGEIINRVAGDVDSIEGIVSGTLTTLVSSLLVSTSTIIIMLIWNWQLALVSFAVVPFMIIPLPFVTRRLYAINLKARRLRDDLTATVQEGLSISGMTLMKSFCREETEEIKLETAAQGVMKAGLSLAMVGRWLQAAIVAMVFIGPAFVWWNGANLAMGGRIKIGLVVAFASFVTTRLYGSMAALVGLHAQIASSLVVFERIFEYLDIPTEDSVREVVLSPDRVKGAMRFENVSYSYKDRPKALNSVTFNVAQGEVAAFVGESGSGKSTLLQLIPRFLEPESGSIFVDDVDLSTVNLKSLRSQIGIVSQETYLFHDTIAQNLRYARPDATDAEIRAAANMANIGEYIKSLPDKYETIVGQRGHRLSGGERQRLAIARVFLTNPKIIILDEATSALDSRNEVLIRDALGRALSGRTCLVAAHRLSTIVSADVIFILGEGKILARGTHDELLRTSEAYRSIHNVPVS